CEVSFEYRNSVQRIHEDPRVTMPYTELQWKRIDTLGQKVDRQLEDDKVMLTMGGEPTFVSIDDMESAQWNTAALGEDKLRLAGKLLRELAERFGKGGYLHHGQGKWYPGEPLPRWAMGIYWRRDHKPLWRDPALLADPSAHGSETPARARKFMQSLCDELGLDRRFALPAYEDAEYYVRREGQLPKNVKANHSKLADPLERERLRRVFDQGPDAVSGHVLPLEWVGSDRKGRWRSSRWQFRRDRLYLLPGDSPLGLRLPLSSLPWEVERDYDFERDPFRELPELDPPELGEDAAGPGRK